MQSRSGTGLPGFDRYRRCLIAYGTTDSVQMMFTVLNVLLAGYIREVNIASPPYYAPQSAKRKQRASDALTSPDAQLSGPRKKVILRLDVEFRNCLVVTNHAEA